MNTPIPVFRKSLGILLNHILSNTLLFQHDKDELSLWLGAMPLGTRLTGSEAPDGAPLTDEGEAVIGFLEECLQRCIKTPYRYLDEMAICLSQLSGDAGLEGFHTSQNTSASPLLMTALEQLDAKCKNASLSPSHTLSIFTYLRILIVKLIQKVSGKCFGKAILSRFTAVIETHGSLRSLPVMDAAVNREGRILNAYVERLNSVVDGEPVLSDAAKPVPEIDAFLLQVEHTAHQGTGKG